MSDPYELLGVRRGAEPEVVDAAYRALMKKYHPDRHGGAADPGRAQRINAAYEEIKAQGMVLSAVPDTDTIWQAPTIVPAPPLRTGRNLAFALLSSAAILAVIAIVATS